MATIILTTVSVCAGGGHIQLNVQFNGNNKGTREVYADDVLAPFDDAEIDTFIKSVIRAYKVGKTPAQVKTALEVGLTVTI